MSARHRQISLAITLGFALVTTCPAAVALYVANYGSDSISSISSAGGVSTSTSSGSYGPVGLAFDGSGRLYVANTFNGGNDRTIVMFTTAGSGSIFVNTGIDFPAAMAFDSGGNLFVADYGNGRIVKFTPSGSSTIFASTLNLPNALAFDSSGNLYASLQNETIMKYTPDGVGSVFATLPTQQTILALAFDSLGNLYGTSHGATDMIAKYTPSGVGSVFATSGLSTPYGIAVDASDNVYASNWGTDSITKFTPAGVSSFFATTGHYPTYLAFGDVGNASEFTFSGGGAVPEPSRTLLLLAGGCGLFLRRRRASAGERQQ